MEPPIWREQPATATAAAALMRPHVAAWAHTTRRSSLLLLLLSSSSSIPAAVTMVMNLVEQVREAGEGEASALSVLAAAAAPISPRGIARRGGACRLLTF